MPEFKKVELEQKLRIANGITRKPGGRELLYDVFPTGAPFSFEALDKFSALCYTEIGILHKSFPRHFKNQESQTMKQRFRRLLSLAAAGVLAAALFVTPAAAADAAENGNEAFDRWAAEAAIAERQRMEQLTELPEDPQAAFEEAAAILEAIENARVMTPIADDEPALIDRDGEPLENETPEKLWAEFIAQFGGGSELSDEEEFPYELRFFTVAGEERFAIYDTRSGRAAAGWQGSTGKWWYSYGDGTWASGWTTINDLTYYFDPNNNDYMVHGWLDDEDSYSQYFMGTPGQIDSGAKYTFGWLNDKEAGGTDAKPIWYYFQSSGAMRHGWLTYKGDRYYMGVPGKPKTGVMYDKGWLTEYGDTYYIGSDGIMKTGWLTVAGDSYYLNESGVLQKAWFTIGNDIYHGNRYNGLLDVGEVKMSEYVTSTFGTDHKWQKDTMNSLGTAPNGAVIQNTRWADVQIRSNGKRGPTLSLAATDEFNQMFSSGTNALIENTASYYTNNTDGLVVVNAGSQYTVNNASMVVTVGTITTNPSKLGALTLLQDSDGRWVDGWGYNFEAKQTISDMSNSFWVGEVTRVVIVVDPHYIKSDQVTYDELQRIIRHEFGHAIGLRHTFNVSYGETDTGITALMYPAYKGSFSSLIFTTYDKNEMGKVYPH